MDKKTLIQLAANYVDAAEQNRIQAKDALDPRLDGMRIFDAPIFAFGRAEDWFFKKLKQPEAVGAHFMTPKEWLPSAQTVITCFFPFTNLVKESMRKALPYPSAQWLHGRFEGQAFLDIFTKWLVQTLAQEGYQSVIPALDNRFRVGLPGGIRYTSNWSERHVGYVCGLGTFGLCGGLITKKGMAGRLCSIVTEAGFDPDIRAYNDIYEYCTRCGACVRRCPVGAVTFDRGKLHPPCSAWLDHMKARFAPRYGCGMCQTWVPCESGIPTHEPP